MVVLFRTLGLLLMGPVCTWFAGWPAELLGTQKMVSPPRAELNRTVGRVRSSRCSSSSRQLLGLAARRRFAGRGNAQGNKRCNQVRRVVNMTEPLCRTSVLGRRCRKWNAVLGRKLDEPGASATGESSIAPQSFRSLTLPARRVLDRARAALLLSARLPSEVPNFFWWI